MSCQLCASIGQTLTSFDTAGSKPERELHMHFLRTPVEILPSLGDLTRAGAVKVEVNTLQPRPDGSQRAVGTGQFESLPVSSHTCPCKICALDMSAVVNVLGRLNTEPARNVGKSCWLNRGVLLGLDLH